METASAIALGVCLAACAGMRAIVPLFVLAVGHWVAPDFVELTDKLTWLGSTPAVITLAIAVIAEFAADKIPALDNALDVLQTPVRTASGMVVMAAPLVDFPTWFIAIMVIIGGGAAFSVHGAKSLIRAASTATTGGLANPVISFIEDGFTWSMVLLAIVIPLLVVGVLAIAGFFFFRKARRVWIERRAGESPATG